MLVIYTIRLYENETHKSFKHYVIPIKSVPNYNMMSKKNRYRTTDSIRSDECRSTSERQIQINRHR